MTISAIRKDLKFNTITMWVFIFLTLLSWVIYLPSLFIELHDYKQRYNELEKYHSSMIIQFRELDGEIDDLRKNLHDFKKYYSNIR